MFIISYLASITFDFIFAFFFVTNLNIFAWRIIWDTQDLYLQTNIYFNSIISLIIAYILIVISKCIQINEIRSKFEEKISTSLKSSKMQVFSHRLKIKLIIFLISMANINHWRCVWNFTLEYTNKSSTGCLSLALIVFAIMFITNRLCSIVSLPFQIGTDDYDAAFKIQPSSANHNYFLSMHEYSATNVSISNQF